MYRIFRKIAEVFNWLFKLLGICLNIRELIAIFAGGGMVTVVAILRLMTETLPLWTIILIPITVFMFVFVVLSLILGKRKKIDNFDKVTEILKNMDERMHKKALDMARKLEHTKMSGLEEDFIQLLRITEDKIKNLGHTYHLRPYEEKYLARKVRKVIGRDVFGFTKKLVSLTDKHNISLKEQAQTDFLFVYYKDQLSNIRPLPTEKINELVETYLDLSLGLNTFLMFQLASLEDIEQMLSIDLQLANRAYPREMERLLNQTLVRVNEAIREFKQGSSTGLVS